MDFKDIIQMALGEYMDQLRKALDGLTPEERRFQPAPQAHHIDFVVWHMARVEDSWINRFAQRTDQIWTRDGWFQRFGIPEDGHGYGFTAEQVADLPRFDLDEMMAYADSVRRETLRYLEGLTHDDLAISPGPDVRPGYTIGRMFSHVIVEESQHVGQVAYLRGIQRGLNR